jgi:hypothetical protein
VANGRNQQQISIFTEVIKAAATIAVAVVGAVAIAQGTTIALAKREASKAAIGIYQRRVLDAFPKGIILPWNPSGDVPPGWAICNGENGTPDLRNRFLMGVEHPSEVGVNGGRNEQAATI